MSVCNHDSSPKCTSISGISTMFSQRKFVKMQHLISCAIFGWRSLESLLRCLVLWWILIISVAPLTFPILLFGQLISFFSHVYFRRADININSTQHNLATENCKLTLHILYFTQTKGEDCRTSSEMIGLLFIENGSLGATSYEFCARITHNIHRSPVWFIPLTDAYSSWLQKILGSTKLMVRDCITKLFLFIFVLQAC